jgi:hypothetical protein
VPARAITAPRESSGVIRGRRRRRRRPFLQRSASKCLLGVASRRFRASAPGCAPVPLRLKLRGGRGCLHCSQGRVPEPHRSPSAR